MTPEQELRAACLDMAVEAGACPSCAIDVAEDFRAYVEGDEPTDPAAPCECASCLAGDDDCATGRA